MSISKESFLQKYNFKNEDFEKTGLDWFLLERIHEKHVGMLKELQSAAEYISLRLQEVPSVHSLKTRIKNAEHLIAKLIRKKIDCADLNISESNYEECITDLIGIRALHLFKDEWKPIHDFITRNWDLAEVPTANIRKGDSEKLIKDFSDAKFEIKEHQFAYRSIHYLIKCQPTKRVYIGELQVRTIFEEGWSEIDHRIRYPRHSDDPYLAHFLNIFNKLAGSADDMGIWVRL